jgi:hypothetical protein
MAKACLSCGTVNASNARFCSGCGKALSSKKTANLSGTQARHGTESSRFCKKCNTQVRVKGKTTDYFPPSSPVKLDWEEWEYYVLECNHKDFIRKTGRTKPDPALEL